MGVEVDYGSFLGNPGHVVETDVPGVTPARNL
jgi:hypothetical protein